MSIPRLLFLPGAAGSPAFWRPVGERLPPAWSKTYLGWPGLGEQPARAGVTGFDDLVRLVEDALPAQPADLLAQSMGGAIALQVALRNPGRVRRLVLAATSGGLDVQACGAADWRPEYRAAYPRAADWVTEPFPDLSAELAALQHAALLLWGDADPLSPVAVGRQLQRLLRNARLEIVPGGDHGFVHDRAADIAPLIEAHLRSELPAPSPSS